ncbi:MAG: hypothetical protein JSW25_07140 [Thermoplasmata archaeon]|nr:MAG: hypothetical protein JSW25_07140 [Thermoplasmata archaeon]
MTGERRRHQGWQASQDRWSEATPSKDPYYDPTAPQSDRYWDDGSGVPQGNPYHQGTTDVRYSYQPPPPAYAQYPPPIYANPYGYPAPYKAPPSPGLPIAGGVMSLISGALGIIWAAITWDDAFFFFFGLGTCLIISIILSVVAILGGIMAMARRMFVVALIGAICGMLNGGFFGISFLFALIALVLIVIGKDAFLDTPIGVTQRY